MSSGTYNKDYKKFSPKSNEKMKKEKGHRGGVWTCFKV